MKSLRSDIIQNDNSNPGFGGPAENFEKLSKNFCTNHSFVRLLVRSKIFQILVRADAIDLVQKSSNFEPSSRFFGRLKILGNFVDRKVWGNFGQWGIQKKFRCSGFAVSFFHYGGGHAPHKEKNETANPGHLNFFLTPHWPKFQQTFLSTKFSQKV